MAIIYTKTPSAQPHIGLQIHRKNPEPIDGETMILFALAKLWLLALATLNSVGFARRSGVRLGGTFKVERVLPTA
jgi:hypothetical protein